MAQLPVLVILAGGASSRLWPLREKSLLRFGTEPRLVRQLRRYQSLGCNEAIVVGHPGNVDDVKAMTSSMSGMKVQVVVRQEPKGMGDALLQAAPLLQDRLHPPIYVN